MFIDGLNVPDNTDLRADIAIIGAGAAGITIAKALNNSGLSVLLIESGGFEYDQQVQELNTAENVGLPYADLTYNRLRFFGGTTNHWGGWCRPLDEVDFEVRSGIPFSGWPFERAHLEPYYLKAQSIVEAGPFAYDDQERLREYVGDVVALKGTNLTLGFVQYSPPTRFGWRYREELQKSKNVKVILNTTVLGLDADEAGTSLEKLSLGCLGGKRHTAQARMYVLATGGIENPRLMLNSTARNPEGVGNQHGLVGRFFMEHPHLAPARLLLTPNDQRALNLVREISSNGLRGAPCLRPTRGMLGQKHLNAFATLSLRLELDADGRPTAPEHPDVDQDDEIAVRRAVSKLRQLGAKPSSVDDAPVSVEAIVELIAEQIPNPESRVTLGDGRDAFGHRHAKLNWQLMPDELTSIRHVLVSWGAALARNGLGHLRLVSPNKDEPWPGLIGWGNHHMGTTRMSDNPKMGVVDQHCRVHGMSNLYVAGSSVFPTSGAANPTLTIVALALRLADRLQEAVT